jgi:transposase
MQLPIFGEGLTRINGQVGYAVEEGQVYYFLGQLPLHVHGVDDLRSFRLITSQLVVHGHIRQVEIVRAFGVSAISVKRSVKRLRGEGIEGFFRERKKRRAHVLTAQVLARAQGMLYRGKSAGEVATALNLKVNTVQKAIQQGRLKKKPSALS